MGVKTTIYDLVEKVKKLSAQYDELREKHLGVSDADLKKAIEPFANMQKQIDNMQKAIEPLADMQKQIDVLSKKSEKPAKKKANG